MVNKYLLNEGKNKCLSPCRTEIRVSERVFQFFYSSSPGNKTQAVCVKYKVDCFLYSIQANYPVKHSVIHLKIWAELTPRARHYNSHWRHWRREDLGSPQGGMHELEDGEMPLPEHGPLKSKDSDCYPHTTTSPEPCSEPGTKQVVGKYLLPLK